MLKMEIHFSRPHNGTVRAKYQQDGGDVTLSYTAESGQAQIIHILTDQFDKICEEYLLIRQRENGRTP